jgi:uncharacterized protein
MRRLRLASLVALIVLLAGVAVNVRRAPDYPIRPVATADVQITDAFWARKMEVNRTASIQHVFTRAEERGGQAPPQLIEAAAYMLEARKDPALEKQMDDLIARMAAGISSRAAANPDNAIRTNGTFLEAAVAYARATGKTVALDAAIKAANAMVSAYGPGKKTYISGHEGLKIGLIALYRQTGDARYRDLAQFFLDERGKDDYPRTGEYAIDRTYAQDHEPVIQQDAAVGHAVRATYLYIPLADVAALTGRPEYGRAEDRIWTDAVYRKTYVTGAIGSIRFHEQFGAPYELPNLSAWGETCASYGNVVWNHRMFLLHKDAQYLDQLERILYNGFLDGVSLKGDRFFYQNPLMSYGDYDRFDWINTPCCPPNVVRLIASLGRYVYATEGPDVYVNLFVGSTAHVSPTGGPVTIKQETRYPWDGHVRIAVDPATPAHFSLNVRVPGWTADTVMPGDLYRFTDRAHERIELRVNGQPLRVSATGGFARIARDWRAGDVVEVSMPMPVRRVVADPRVRDDVDRVALERGPLVYAAEWPDNGGHALNIVVADNASLTSEFRNDLLDGVEVITGKVQALVRNGDAAPKLESHQLVAIPYYAWANRGMGEMQVWLPRKTDGARATPVVTPATIAAVKSSGGIEKKWTGYNDQNDDIAAVYDGVTPISSADESHLYFRMRPPVGQPAWVEYQFKKPTTVSSSEVYFADDRRFCKLPTSWRITYLSNGEWKPVTARGSYRVDKDTFNRVQFDPVTTTAIRIEVEPVTKHYSSGEIGPPDAMFLNREIEWREFGLIEWRVK